MESAQQGHADDVSADTAALSLSLFGPAPDTLLRGMTARDAGVTAGASSAHAAGANADASAAAGVGLCLYSTPAPDPYPMVLAAGATSTGPAAGAGVVGSNEQNRERH